MSEPKETEKLAVWMFPKTKKSGSHNLSIQENKLRSIEDYRVPDSASYDAKIHLHLRRIRMFELKKNCIIAKHHYKIGSETYEVNSVFRFDSPKATDDNLAALIKNDIEKSLDIENG